MRQEMIAVLSVVLLACGVARAAETLDAKVQAKIDATVKDVAAWASDAAIVSAVKAQNAAPSDEVKAMTQEKWKALPLTDPFVRGLSKNAAGQFLKSKKSDVISEAFVSSADGTKVALLSKTSGWSHKGKAKHDDPMAGKTWQGPIEVDESTGMQQLQIAVPVKDGDKVIGSLVVGLNVMKLKD